MSDFQLQKEKQFKITNDDGKDEIINGDEIIKLPNGQLTTMYHYMKNSDLKIEEVLTNTEFENADL